MLLRDSTDELTESQMKLNSVNDELLILQEATNSGTQVSIDKQKDLLAQKQELIRANIAEARSVLALLEAEEPRQRRGTRGRVARRGSVGPNVREIAAQRTALDKLIQSLEDTGRELSELEKTTQKNATEFDRTIWRLASRSERL